MNQSDINRVVISVGQCSYDNGRVRALIRTIDDRIEVLYTDTAKETGELINQLGDRVALVLLNRVFDADGDSGIDLIRSLGSSSAKSKPAMMLVSNYEESQAQAIAHGALPGFGKSALHAAETRERLEAALR